jgi:DNA repair protein RecO (recombination protein O)
VERIRARAVVLSTVDYGEADRIATLLTEERGRLAAFAAGARKSRRRFAGALEPCTLLWAQLVQGRGDTWRLDGVEVIDAFAELRSDLARMARGAYAAELSRELCRDLQPHPELHALLCRFLAALARQGAGALSMMRFELLALALAGLMPRLDRCCRCGAPPESKALFDPEHGGLLCPACAQGDGQPISPEAARLLAQLQREPQRGEPPRHVRAEARALLTRFVSHHLGRRPKSFDFMREVGVEV